MFAHFSIPQNEKIFSITQMGTTTRLMLPSRMPYPTDQQSEDVVDLLVGPDCHDRVEIRNLDSAALEEGLSRIPVRLQMISTPDQEKDPVVEAGVEEVQEVGEGVEEVEEEAEAEVGGEVGEVPKGSESQNVWTHVASDTFCAANPYSLLR